MDFYRAVTNFNLHVETVFSYLLSASSREPCQHDIHEIALKKLKHSRVQVSDMQDKLDRREKLIQKR